LFYGVQTLLQLLPKEIENQTVTKAKWTIPAVKITDYPRFAWRGFMLDVSRHFFSVADVKRHIDDMVRYKYNTFHWHLTDDNGWRVEIKSLPKLTEVGACRVPRHGSFGTLPAPKDGEAATDCGFYTQDQIRDIIAYAAERYVTILPEVDVPGHSSAIIAAYPELNSTKDGTVKVSPGHKFSEWYGNGSFKMLHDNSLDPSDERVYTTLDKIFGEIAALFPNPYIHVGGDECYHGYWEKNPACQELMKKEGIKNSHELQSYFIKRCQKILATKGKKLIGWDEILDGGLPQGAAVMSWQGLKGAIEAAKQNSYAVMTPNDFVYTDLIQGDPSVEPDATFYKTVRLRKTFDYEIIPEGVDSKWIMGGQVNLWTEKVPTYRHAQYMTFPRAWAFSDALWSPMGTKNWDFFIKKMETQMERADAAGINYARSCYDPIVSVRKDGEKLFVSLATEVSGLDIFYTIDATTPDKYTPQYTAEMEVPEGVVHLKVVTYRNGKPIGRQMNLLRSDLVSRVKK
jgi:hexosaminidase